ncbi:ATP12 family chaperone protein [Jannaschia aquimarina]|uniref:ATP12 chaperone protein n=1 Tax=Jannaschia aquimarina TaxID=935700 RepID=A0A0D1EEN9_9RHOB|nr:ATP12 family protein [Jannaschia aquimarina]KIT14340.1 ATP12 chaperone protein [Jannaschia aquimarina]SNS86502.1 Chaperone required for the assembly of the F1-ATPase [Jannaschia aquimarina]
MSEWAARRFWSEARVEETAEGHAIRLDGRPVRTPAKTELIVPTRPLAEEIASEWDAQDGVIDPMSMPLTRAANATLDKVRPQRDAVIQELSGYGASDLLCYRADAPAGLVERQTESWDPMLAWARDELGAGLNTTSGVMPVSQDAAALATLRSEVAKATDWQLTALSEFVTLSGSLVLGLAALVRRAPLEALWDASRVDEMWQIEQWGEDVEEAERVAVKRGAFLQAGRFRDLAAA